MEPRAIYLAGWNELFFTNTPPYFERNRFFLGAGFMWNKRLVTQIGWLTNSIIKLTMNSVRIFCKRLLAFK
jgi:hypothetical protein